ncbi:MAG: ECF transporter S component [Clostridiales bacterium]|nr:ECF transporter S component [Clostridiales bacterium]
MNQTSNLNKLIKISLMAVIAFIVMFFEIALPIFPEFLKIDLSDIPALITGFALGPVAGIGVELVKNILHLFRTSTGGVGELANFLVGVAFVYPAALIYSHKKDKKSAIIGMVAGTVSMAIVGALANYYILLPFYENFMPIEAIVGMAAAVNNLVVDMKTLILYAIVPFNLVKGIVVSLITIPVYKKISKVLHR